MKNILQQPSLKTQQMDELHRLDDRLRIARDHQFFLCGDDKNAHLRCGCGNFGLNAVQRLCIDRIVNLNAKIGKIAADIRADELAVFANAACKDDCVHTVERGNIGADIFADLIPQHFTRQEGALIALGRRFGQITIVARNAGDAEHTGFFIEHLIGLLGRPALFACK